MSNFSENFGLDVLMEDDEIIKRLLNYILSTGKPISNYYACPYIYSSMGKPEYFASFKPEADKTLKLCEFDSHCTGNCIWNMVHTGLELSPKDPPRLNRVICMSRPDGEGMIPVELITADVYPSFLEGDEYKIQVIGLPLDISYYADEEAYSQALPKDDEGQQWGIANGSLIAANLLRNHDPERQGDYDPETDKYVLFTATVKRVIWGIVKYGEEEEKTFLRCFVDTLYGELEFEHTLDQVDKEQWDNIREGAIVSGTCVISGDLAIDEYEKGIIRDHEHDLRLLRYTFEKGEEERLKTVLCDDTVYTSEQSGKELIGSDAILKHIRYVTDNRNGDLATAMATITEAEDGMEYTPGTRCFLLAYGKDKNFEAIVFIDVDENGMISRIKISTDSRYHFIIDEPPKRSSIFEDCKLPDSIEEAMLLRAKSTRAIRPWDEALEDFQALTKRRDVYRARADKLFEKAAHYMQSGLMEKMKCLFGSLFLRAFEERLLSEICVVLPEPEADEMFSDEPRCRLNAAWKNRLNKAYDYGKYYFRDYKNYCDLTETNGSDKELFIHAAVMTQEIGEAYAVKHMEEAPIEYTAPEDTLTESEGSDRKE